MQTRPNPPHIIYETDYSPNTNDSDNKIHSHSEQKEAYQAQFSNYLSPLSPTHQSPPSILHPRTAESLKQSTHQDQMITQSSKLQV